MPRLTKFCKSSCALTLLSLVVVSLSSTVPAFVLATSALEQGNVLVYADFTGSSLPANWFLQGTAKFLGGLDASTGAGGVQLVSSYYQEGAAIYGAAVSGQNIVVEFSGVYSGSGPEADDMGLGFYSGGPAGNNGVDQPASPSGYYAAYEFFTIPASTAAPALMYDGIALDSGPKGSLPESGLNYIFTRTIVTPSSVSMNALTSSSGPFMDAPSISPGNIVTYNGTVDNSHSTLYVGGATGGGGCGNCYGESSNQYLYWVRISTSTPVPEYPAYLLPLVASLTLVILALNRSHHLKLPRQSR